MVPQAQECRGGRRVQNHGFAADIRDADVINPRFVAPVAQGAIDVGEALGTRKKATCSLWAMAQDLPQISGFGSIGAHQR